MVIDMANEEKKKFLFVSYCHRDSDLVLPIIEKLKEKYDVWYDKDIKHGKEWSALIAKNIKECSVFLYMVTDNSLQSDPCKDEIAFAKDKGVPFIPVVLEDVEFPDEFSLQFSRYQMCFLSKSKTIEGLADDLNESIVDILNKEETISPDFIIKDGVLVSYEGVLEKVIIPNSVTSIGEEAFAGNESLESVVIPTSVTSIGKCAFEGCSALKSITVPSSVIFIGPGAFYECSSLKSATIRGRITSIEGSLFEKCSSLESFVIPDTVTSIGMLAFSNCSSLKSVIIPDGVVSIDVAAFAHCTSLESLSIPDSVTSLRRSVAFGCSSLKTVSFPESVVSTGASLFCDCLNLKCNSYDNGLYVGNASNPYVCLIGPKKESIKRIVVNENCKVINALSGVNLNLRSIKIPKGVVSISPNALQDFDLKIAYEGTTQQWRALVGVYRIIGGYGRASVRCADGYVKE